MTSGNFLWCYFSSLMFCFFILNYLFSSLFTIICNMYIPDTALLSDWLYISVILKPRNLTLSGTNPAKLEMRWLPSHWFTSRGSVHVCLLSPNSEKKIFHKLGDFLESTLTLHFHHGSSEAELKVLSLAEFRRLRYFYSSQGYIISLWFWTVLAGWLRLYCSNQTLGD